VDGTNGDTYLKSVTARFLHTQLAVKGEIVDVDRDGKGRTVMLEAVSQDARVEDLIHLTSKGKDPVITGPVTLKTKIDIPQGNGDVIERLKSTGQFEISDAQFPNPSLQGKVDTFSRKGQGQPKNMEINDVASKMGGNFRVGESAIYFSNLNFGVPGASINLIGSYNLESGALNFHGKLMLQAKPSQTTTGVKSFFLRALDPFFKGKNGGTEVAFKITGTKDKPSFGLDHGRASD
jgi:hypothetical protein